MRILNVGNNIITDQIDSFKNNLIQITTISDINLLPNNTNFEIVFINIPTCLNLDGSQNIDNIQNAVKDINNKYNNPLIVNTTFLIPGSNELLGTNYIYIRNNDIVNNEWNISTKTPEEKSTLENFINLLKNSDLIKSEDINHYSFLELELISYSDIINNSFKNSLTNELKEYCQIKNINFNKIATYLNFPNNIDIKSHIQELICFSHNIDSIGSSDYLLSSIINRFIHKDHTQLDWLPDNKDFNEEIETNNLKSTTLTQLNLYCEKNNIDINDCIERRDVVDKIINFKKTKLYKIKYLNPKSSDVPVIQNTTNIPTQNPQSNSNSIPRASPQRQSGIPLQLNQPTVNLNRPFNMNVRNNNANTFMNLRPGSSNGQGQGGIRFGGGVQSVR